MLRSRSACSCAAVLALLATPVAGFLLLRPDRALERSTPRASEFTPTTRPPANQRVQLVVDASQLAAARSSARSFSVQYAAYIAGRIAAHEIADATPEILRELRRHPRQITPTEQRRRPTLRRVRAAPSAATVHALAPLQDASGPPYRLSLSLERRGPRWLVT